MSAVVESSDRPLEILEAYLPPAPDVDLALRIDNVSVAFGGVRALEDVSIAVPARKVVGLIGPNGAGKSTLFDVINGLRKPSRGEVQLFGKAVTRMNPWDRAKQGLSRTFQANRVDAELSVIDNLLAGAYHNVPGGLLESIVRSPRVRAAERRTREVALAVADLLDLTSSGDEPVGSLDFGTLRRVEIGRSLMGGPRLLLLDEPSAGLDASEAAQFFALIRRLEADLGLTVLLVEHYVKAVLENCDLVYVLDQGQVLAAGPPEEIRVNPQVRAAYLGGGSETKGGTNGNA